MRKFSHIGLPTDDKQPNETYVESTKVWVTGWEDHPYKVEFLRYEPDSPVTGPLRELPHIAFETDDLQREIQGEDVILEPFEALPGLTVVFILKDGAVFEFMEYADE
jgi:hypothetical protein